MSIFLSVRRLHRPDQPEPVYKGALGTKLWEAPLYAAIGDAQRNGSVRPEACASLDVRRSEWAPDFDWVQPVVDATVRTWAGIWPAELRSERSRDGVRLDVRSYDWAPEFTWVRPVVDATVAKWASVWSSELAGTRSADRLPLDVRFDPGPPAWIFKNLPSAATTAQLWPGILAGLAPGYRSADRATLDVRVPPWRPAFTWVNAVTDATIRTWAPIFSAERLGERTRDRLGMDPGYQDWDPAFSWVKQAADTVVSQRFPAIASELSYRSAEALPFDVRHAIWAPAFGVPVPDATVDQQIAAFAAALAGYRTADGGRYELRTESAGLAGWVGRIVDAGVAQQLPVHLANLAPSYRSPAAAPLDVRRSEWSPEFGWAPKVVDGVVALWMPAVTAEPSYRSAERQSLDARLPEWRPPSGWLARVIDSVLSAYAPVWGQQASTLRSASGPLLDVRFDPGPPAWIFKNLPLALTVAQLWPAVLQNLGLSYRSGDRPVLDVRGHDWAPQFGWAERVVEAGVSLWMPAITATPSFRSSDPARLDVRGLGWNADVSAWLLAALTGPASVAQLWPAILQAMGISYRSADRAVLDVRSGLWVPSSAWLPRVVDGVVASYAPVWASEASGHRSADRSTWDVRSHEWRPEHGWSAAAVNAVLAQYAPIWQQFANGALPPNAPRDVRRRDWNADVASWIAALLAGGPVVTPTGELFTTVGSVRRLLKTIGRMRRAIDTDD